MDIAYLIGSVPPLVLLGYVWYLDRAEHEPLGLVAKACLGGAFLGTLAAMVIEELGAAVLDATYVASIPLVGNVVYYFVVVALVEEFCKRLPVMLFVWKSPEFDYRFDAIVYCVASAVGFAAFENVMYISTYGADIALGRLIPVHTICGVFMGYYLAHAKACERAGDNAGKSSHLRLSLLVPMAIHGCWDFCVSSDSLLLNLAALGGTFILTVYAWRLLKRAAAQDAPL